MKLMLTFQVRDIICKSIISFSLLKFKNKVCSVRPSAAPDRNQNLATYGQNPSSMVISCCDSRVHATSIFGADAGEFFIHRNIANLVPSYSPDGENHGTSAAISEAEFPLG